MINLSRVIRFQTSDKRLWEEEDEAIQHEEKLKIEKILRESCLWEYGTGPTISDLAEWLQDNYELIVKESR